MAPARTHTASTATPKGQRWADTLDHARRLALFSHPHPGLARGGVNTAAIGQSGLKNAAAAVEAGGAGAGQGGQQGADAKAHGFAEWKEVLRKFRKHNPGREVTASAANADQITHALLAKVVARSPPSPAIDIDAVPPLPPFIPAHDRPPALTALESLQNSLRNVGAASQIEVDSARIVLAQGRFAVGEPQEALVVLRQVEYRNLPHINEAEGYDLTLRVVLSLVEGYALESLGEREQALSVYENASQVYQQAVDELARSPGGDKDDVSLHRAGGAALFHLALLSRIMPSSSLSTSYTAHQRYLHRSASFSRASLAFPAYQRLPIHRSFRSLQVLLNRHDAALTAQNDKAEERLIRESTSLPKAGETNRVYLKFLDEVVEGWRRRGARKDEAGDVVEILYNALTHTFQSQLLLRHLIRALTVAGRYDEAAKALALYRELWDKARETDAKEVAREMKKLRARASAQEVGEKSEKEGLVNGHGEHDLDDAVDVDPYASDIDADAVFIDTLIYGVRLLCKFVDRPKVAVELAKRAREVFDEGRDERLKEYKVLEARIERTLGVALGALAAKEANPAHRPTQHSDALQHLSNAVALNPTSYLSFYSLAYQLLELRQVSPALDAARQAVQLNKQGKEAWHLLALCVSAQKDMQGALEVLETALDIDGATEDDDTAETLNGDANKPNGRAPRAQSVVVQDQWDSPTDEIEHLATEMQLRLSKNTVVEYLEGAAAALSDQQDVLAYFSAACPNIAVVSPVANGGAARSRSRTAGGGDLAPPVPNVGGGTVSRAASIVSRRKSVKRQSQAIHGAPIPPALASDSLNGSMANLSVNGDASQSTGTAGRPSAAASPRATKLLVDAWLASAASFRRAGKLDEAKGAIGEAEKLDPEDPDVWAQLALLFLTQGEKGKARDTLMKALTFNPQHPPSLIVFSRLYLTPPDESSSTPTAYAAAPPPPPSHLTSPNPASSETSSPEKSWIALQLPLAESMLDTLTQHAGWDSPEAWFELSKCYKLTGRKARERECLVWALQLEETRPVRNLQKAVQRCL
ncbi:microtubule-associated protein [Rhodotorula toruloides]|uniref:Microtubule-associated protein n=1 Tax=Rhodotorula toruloides TaxID=5286 RepID=A0A511K970_RHOTO|nr:microtubule-associated protein [Rhodotorula toruloides]